MKYLGWMLIGACVLLHRPTPEPDYPLIFDTEPSAISTAENPAARANYEQLLLANPQSGKIPEDIKSRELQFALQLDEQFDPGRRQNTLIYDLAGPFNVGGRTRSLALDVLDENRIIAGGVSGGIWVSENGGSSWKRTSDPFLRNSVTALDQDIRPGKTNNWYFGTGELVGNSARTLTAPYRGAGVYKSTDNGLSWSQLISTSNGTPDAFTNQFQYIWDIATNPNNTIQDEVFVAAFGGILRSQDGGNSWSVVLGQPLFFGNTNLNQSTAPYYTTIRRTPSGKFLAVLSTVTVGEAIADGGVYYSETGESWQDITPPGFPDVYQRTVIGYSQDESAYYFLTQADQVNLWKFEPSQTINGNLLGNWTNLSNNVPMFGGELGDYNSQESYNMVIEVHPENKDVVFIGGTNLYRSTDGFQTNRNTQWVGGYSTKNNGSTYPGHYPDQHKLIFFPSDANTMLSANDGGIRKTNNNLRDSIEWFALNNGYVTSQFYTISQQPEKPTDKILGGMQDTGSYLRDALGENPPWNRILGGDGGYCALTPIDNLLYVSFQNSQIYRLTLSSDYQLSSFARVDPIGGGEASGQPYLFINPFILDPINPSRMFLTGGNVIWRNENVEQIPTGSQEKTAFNWTKISSTKISSGIYTAIAKSFQDDVVYAGVIDTRPTIVKIEQASEIGLEIVTKLSDDQFPETGHIACLAIDPQNQDHLMAVFSNYGVPSLFWSMDGGISWEDVSGNLEEFPDGSGTGPSVRWAEVVPTTDGLTYFVGTSIGLYRTDELDGQNTVWTREADEIIGKSVITMMDFRPSDGRLVIASHGNGTFRTFVNNALDIRPKIETTESAKVSAFPNPFTEKTYFTYTLPEADDAQVDLLDSRGMLIRNLLRNPQYAGENRIVWDGKNNAGVPVPSGIYYVVLQYRGKKYTQRVVCHP